MVIKTDTMVPGVYVKKSRDFQLLCKVLDAIQNATLGNIYRIPYQNSGKTCDDQMLRVVAEKVGFFTEEYIPAETLRNIAILFPYIRKNKGNMKGIKLAFQALFRAYPQVIDEIKISKLNLSESGELVRSIWPYIITAEITVVNFINIDVTACKELLKYVLPVGYTVEVIQTNVDGRTKRSVITL